MNQLPPLSAPAGLKASDGSTKNNELNEWNELRAYAGVRPYGGAAQSFTPPFCTYLFFIDREEEDKLEMNDRRTVQIFRLKCCTIRKIVVSLQSQRYACHCRRNLFVADCTKTTRRLRKSSLRVIPC